VRNSKVSEKDQGNGRSLVSTVRTIIKQLLADLGGISGGGSGAAPFKEGDDER